MSEVLSNMGEQTDNDVECSSETTVKISFGVKRKEVTKLIKPTTDVTGVHIDSDEERDLEEAARAAKRQRLDGFTDGSVRKDEDEKDDKLVIPLVVENDWRVAKLMEKLQAGTITDEEKARLAILTEDKPFDFETETSVSVSAKQTITIGGEELKVAVDADYKSMPIEQFGLAILRGCGWKDGTGIGRNPKVVPLQVNAQRPKGLGLGATPKHPEQKTSKGSKEDEETGGEITRDSLVKITTGRNSGKYGKVESRDDDNNSAYVRLALGGESVKASLFGLQKVSKKEYEREAKCLNKKEYDSAKAQIDKKRTEMEKEVRRKERGDNDVIVLDSREGPSREELWVRPDLIVRFIDKDYGRGRLYKQKLRVVDVASRKEISLEDDYGQVYYNLKQTWMETVIPRNEGDRIMVVRGRYSGSPAVMEKKDKGRDRVAARLLNRDNKMVDLDFDDVCLFKPKYEEDM